MARPIVLSNGELHVGLNAYGLVHDFYYPYVGFENHAAGGGLRHKIGVFIDGAVSWLDDKDSGWTFDFHYPHTALVGHTVAKNDRLGIILEFDDTVDAEMSAFVRNIHVINQFEGHREIILYMHQAFVIGDSRSSTDTAQYLPDSNAILHYRGRRAFVISGDQDGQPFDQFTIGLFGDAEHEGSYRDAEDGVLSGNVIEHGRVDSILGFTIHVEGRSSSRIHYWIAAGMSMREALYIHRQVQEQGVQQRISKTAEWWQEWLKPAIASAKRLPKEYQERFIESVMIIKSQMDKRGAIIASTDSTLLNYSKDGYAYSWPRDGANVVWPLIRLGYYQEAYRYFEFCQRGLHPSGYLMHKYRADGALGSSWHPYVHGDIIAPPIQEDETALTVFVFVQFYMLSKDSALIKDFYHSMIKPMANFMADFIDEPTGLPKPTYDLWEERFLINTHTTAVTYGALIAVSELAEVTGDDESAVRWRSAAEGIQEAAHKYLFNKDRNALYRGVLPNKDGIYYDETIDNAAIFGAYMFGLFDSESPEMVASIKTVEEVFSQTLNRPGLPRYENDAYRRSDMTTHGNWWYITTLWKAQYYLDQGNPEAAKTILNWIQAHMSSTGMMGEQIHPQTEKTIAPSPLTWSHAEYIGTLLDLADGGNA